MTQKNEVPPGDSETLWGAEAIAVAADLRRPDGTPDVRKAFYLLARGHLPGKKVGPRLWTSTRAAIRLAVDPKAA